MDHRSLEELERHLKTALEHVTLLKYRIETDDLTSLLRRGAFMAHLEEILSSAFQRNSTVQIMMIDIDHFKRVNDSYGHQAGDEVLERVSQLVKNYLRPQDLAGRYGGEEIIVAVECDDDTAHGIAERIRQAVEQAVFQSMRASAEDAAIEGHLEIGGSGPGSAFHVTLSLGMASTSRCGYDVHRLIKEADAALYIAKNTGRNRILRAVPAVA